jgi:hypothetical protein
MASSWERFTSFAGGFVSKCFIQGQPFELADLILIQGADAQVANLLPFGRLARSTGPRCPNRLFDLRHYLYDNPENRLYNDIISPCVRRRVGLYPKATAKPDAFSVESICARHVVARIMGPTLTLGWLRWLRRHHVTVNALGRKSRDQISVNLITSNES